MTAGYRSPVLLAKDHDLRAFACGSVEQTRWLRLHARQASATGTTRVLVVTEVGSHAVVAYYGWCMASVAVRDVPLRMRKGGGGHPQPVALLARLGVDIGHEGRGLAAGLMADVIARTAAVGAQIGCRGLLVHVENDQARAFYEHLDLGWERSPTDERHLYLLMKDIRRSLR